MAKQINVGVGGVVKKVKEVPLGIGGVVKKAKKGVCGIGGVVKTFFEPKTWLYDNGNNIENVELRGNNYTSSVTYGSSYATMPADYGTRIVIPKATKTWDFSKYSKIGITVMVTAKGNASYIHFDLSCASGEWKSPYPSIQLNTKVTYEIDISQCTTTDGFTLYFQGIDGSSSGSLTNKFGYRLYELWLE